MSVASTRRYRLRRAIERGDPRLGLIAGLLISLLCAVAFVKRDLVGIAEALELKALDVAIAEVSAKSAAKKTASKKKA